MIFSVPHSGTRSLQELLCLPGGSYRHFGIHDEEIASFSGRVHIPVRNPKSMAMSWAARGLSVDDLIRSMALLARYVESHEVTMHVMESLPNLIGEHPDPVEPDLSLLGGWMKRSDWQRVWGIYDR
jgi:hypothetical protein